MGALVFEGFRSAWLPSLVAPVVGSQTGFEVGLSNLNGGMGGGTLLRQSLYIELYPLLLADGGRN